jgi:hypothetical protein
LKCESAIHPATADEVDLLLEFLAAPEQERRQTAAQLRSRLDQQRANSPFARQAVPCHRPLGLYVLLPPPLAAWLASTFALSDDDVNTLRERCTGWLGSSQTICCATESVEVKAQ